MPASELMVARYGQIDKDGTYRLGMCGRIDPNDPTYTLIFDQTEQTPDCLIEVTQPTTHFKLRWQHANRLGTGLGLPDRPNPNPPPGAGLVRSFESRPADQWGGSEAFMLVTMPSGLILATVEYEVDGRRWISAPLTMERAS